jgi:hypothetical protein
VVALIWPISDWICDRRPAADFIASCSRPFCWYGCASAAWQAGAGIAGQVHAVVDHAHVAQRLRRAVQARVPRRVDRVEVGVGLGRHVVPQHRVVEDVAEVADAVDAVDLALQLVDLLDLVVDLGDAFEHLQDRLDQVGNIDDGDALRAGAPLAPKR